MQSKQMKKHGPWKIRSSREIYTDPFIDVRGDDVIRPDGKDGHHVVVHMKPGVCVVAKDNDNFVYLTNEFHYGVGRYSLEAVSGGIETNEASTETALRELQEELGIRANNLSRLGCVDPFTTIVVSPTELFLATQLEFGETNQEGTEEIECVKMPLDEAVSKVLAGEITHAPTCTLLLMINQI